MKNVMLIDGNSLMFKAFFATYYTGSWMKTSDGFPTNALYGVANMFYRLLTEKNPDYLLVAFDTGKPTVRHQQYKDYKAGRAKAPEELFMQIPKVYEMIERMGIFHYSQVGIEADDIIGTVAKSASNHGFKVEVYSSDKDLLQLVDQNIDVCLTRKGISDLDIHTMDNFKEKNQIEPFQVVELKGLMGDSSDNLPGVKGVGAKTAIKLLDQFTNINNIYKNISEIKGALNKKLVDGKESALMCRDLATLYTDCDLPFKTEKLEFNSIDKVEFKKFCQEFEMNSIAKRL